MRKTVSLSICICSCGVCLYSSSALSSAHCTNLVSDIKPNPTVKSKPASEFTKLAGVYFISKDNSSQFESAGTDVKNDIKNCPSGTTWYEGSCQKNCDRTLYPFETKPDEKKGVAQYTFCQGELLFGYKSCNDGWLLNGGNCLENPCVGYDYTSIPSSAPGSIVSCKSGTTIKYGYSGCNDGWDLHNGNCNIHICDADTYPYTSSPGSTAGTILSCKTGTTIKYGYSTCYDGWTKSGGYCNMNACTGYPSSTSTISGCKTVSSCQKGLTTLYKCDVVYDGYKINSDGTITQTCTYTATSKPSNCASATSCKRGNTSGTKTYYNSTCTTCSSGYQLSGGKCTLAGCSGYPSSSSSISGCSSTASCEDSGGTHYKCTRCYSNYDLSYGQCYRLDNNCSGLSSIPENAVSYSTCIGEDTGKAYYCATACPSGSCDWCNPGEGHGKWIKSGCTCKCDWDGTGSNVCIMGWD